MPHAGVILPYPCYMKPIVFHVVLFGYGTVRTVLCNPAPLRLVPAAVGRPVRPLDTCVTSLGRVKLHDNNWRWPPQLQLQLGVARA
eukprot:354574-Chlamydomonas_euryale.AAC.9